MGVAFPLREHQLITPAEMREKGIDPELLGVLRNGSNNAGEQSRSKSKSKSMAHKRSSGLGGDVSNAVRNLKAERNLKDKYIGEILRRWWYVFPEQAKKQAQFDKEVEDAWKGAREQAGKMPMNPHLSKADQQVLHANKVQHIAQCKLATRASVSGGLKSNKLTCLPFQDFFNKFKKEGHTGTAAQLKSHCYELTDYPGVFRNGEGQIFDLRPQPQISYSFLDGYDGGNCNKAAASTASSVTTLKKLLTKGIENQVEKLKGFMKQNKHRPEDEVLLGELEGDLKQLRNGGLKA